MVVSEKFDESQGQDRRATTGFRSWGSGVSGDYRPQKIGAKIRDAQLELIPYMLIVGRETEEMEQVSVRGPPLPPRRFGEQWPIDAVVEKFQAEIRARRRSAESVG